VAARQGLATLHAVSGSLVMLHAAVGEALVRFKPTGAPRPAFRPLSGADSIAEGLVAPVFGSADQ
jgi:hypothetical protein